MSFAGLIPDFQCMTGGDPGDPDNSSSLGTNVCSVNGSECQSYKFMGVERTVISEVCLYPSISSYSDFSFWKFK